MESANISQHSYLEPFVCSEERCINLANEAAIDFELPMDILTGAHHANNSKQSSELNNY